MRLRAGLIAKFLSLLEVVYSIKLLYYRDLARLIQGFKFARSTGISLADFIALFTHVTHRKPAFILELGAGQSSAVIALATLTYGGAKRFVAVEENSEWLNHHKEIIPSYLSKGIILELISVGVSDEYGSRAAKYVSIPRFPYEFVHIDGPDHDRVDAKISCDILDLLPYLAPHCIVIFDGREASARFAQPHLEQAGFRLRRHFFTLSHEFVR
jgi:hypothetical protein